MPAPSDEARRSAASWALTAMIHGRRAPGTRRISRVASTPSSPGISRSMRITSSRPRRQASTTAAPSATVRTRWPRRSSRRCAICRLIGIVVGDQDLQRSAARRRGRRLGGAHFRRRRDPERHLQRERGALAGHAGAADPAAHEIGEPRADGEAQAGAAVAARHRRVTQLERLEDLGHAVGLDADAGVADVDAQHRHGAAAVGDERAQPHLADRGELDGVAEQVVHDLRQPRPIAEQPVRDVVGDRALDPHRPVADRGPRRLDDRRDERPERERRRLDDEAARLDLRQVEDVVDHA